MKKLSLFTPIPHVDPTVLDLPPKPVTPHPEPSAIWPANAESEYESGSIVTALANTEGPTTVKEPVMETDPDIIELDLALNGPNTLVVPPPAAIEISEFELSCNKTVPPETERKYMLFPVEDSIRFVVGDTIEPPINDADVLVDPTVIFPETSISIAVL
jgi:hypothetical protein